MSKRTNKVVLIGAGHVGMSYAYSLINQSIVEQLIIIDLDEDRVNGEVMDLNHGTLFTQTPTKVIAGQYKDCIDADIVCITAGVSQHDEDTRLTVVDKNISITKDIVTRVMKTGFDGIFLVATNPVDIISYAIWRFSGLPSEKVIGSGTLLDTSRYKSMLSDYFNVSEKSVEGYVVGEHGDSQVAVMSSTKIGGQQIEKFIKNKPEYDEGKLKEIPINVIKAADNIFSQKGSTHYGIGLALARLTKAILKDENIILPVSSYLSGEYGFNDVYMGTPAVINRSGIREVIELDLSDIEKASLNESVSILKNIIKSNLINNKATDRK